MDIVACASCGKLFNYIRGARVCQACQKKLDEKFQEVKKYVRENPNIAMNELCEAMEVSHAQVKRWVREERLVFSDDSPIGLPCEGCGMNIKTGRFCNSCKNNLTNDFRQAAGMNANAKENVRKVREGKDNRMRFLD